MKTFSLNNKIYKARPFDFNLVCDLEEQGISMEQIGDKPMSLIRTYVAFCGDFDKERAGKEIEAHVIDGGSLDEVSQVLSKEIEESGFFRALQKKSETEGEDSAQSPKSKKE